MADIPEPVPREEASVASVVSLEDARRRARAERLTRVHGPYLLSLARRLCRTHLDPEDLVQDVLEKTVRAPDSVPDGGDERNERAWLSRVLHNLFIDRLRRRTSRREQPIVEDPVAEPPAPRAWWEELGEREIRAQLARLPDEQRVTFELFAFAGRSYEEIAAELGIAKATVGTRILRARQKLRLLLDEECRDD